MQVRKILGGVVIDQMSHSIAKLEDGKYAVGKLQVGQRVQPDAQFGSLSAAYDHWLLLALAFRKSAQGSAGSANTLARA